MNGVFLDDDIPYHMQNDLNSVGYDKTSVSVLRHVLWSDNDQWDILGWKYDVNDTKSQTGTTGLYSILTVGLCIKRYRSYYEIAYVFPIIIMTILALQGVLMPST